MEESDETGVTDLTIQPDGRVYVFGLSRPVLEVLATLPAVDPWPQRLLEQLQRADGETVRVQTRSSEGVEA